MRSHVPTNFSNHSSRQQAPQERPQGGNWQVNAALLLACLLGLGPSIFAQAGWITELPDIGTFSSPRVTDLNLDGVKDIVMGAGRLEFQACDSAVIALDGKTGELLWQVSASDQMFGSAIFQDITEDGVADIFIGGRSAELIAIDGTNGAVIWRFLTSNKQTKVNWFNFYNPQWIADQDQDGWRDLLVSNGGDVNAAPHDPNRPAGYLAIISAKTGKILSQALMPDGRETYLSPVVLPAKTAQETEILFGTGGETIGGSFYLTSLAAVLQEDLSAAIRLDSSANKGYVGPPVRVDVTQDQVLDIVTNSVDGRLMAFDGKDHRKLWEIEIPGTESYSSITVGNFTSDGIPDVFVSYGRGVWPNLEWGVQVMVNGANGTIEFKDSLGFYQNATPLAADVTGDGIDEVLMSLNSMEINELGQRFFYTSLVVIGFVTNEAIPITHNLNGSNLSSTPWIGDLDNNGFLDILYLHGTNHRATYDFGGMNVQRFDTQIPIYQTIKWGSYQGSDYTGVFCPD
ncbi:MAG: PQQ-binding-like beta-propeller repeat protein [Bacteroidota bacterium]